MHTNDSRYVSQESVLSLHWWVLATQLRSLGMLANAFFWFSHFKDPLAFLF